MKNISPKVGDCCQEYYDIPIGHTAYHCSGNPKPLFYLPRKENRMHFSVKNCACSCHTGAKPKLKTIEDILVKVSITLPPSLKKGEQIQFLIRQKKSNEEILLQVKTTINSIRWHRTKMKGRD